MILDSSIKLSWSSFFLLQYVGFYTFFFFPIRISQAAVKGGLDRETALRALTTAPAEILGAEENIGSLAPEKDADIQLYKKGEDPLGLMSEPRLVMINGVIVRREDTI